MWAFLQEESGQTTTEYVLLLLFVVIAVRAVGGGLKGKLEGIMNAAFNKTTDAINQSGE
jgi:Flp pilus assembly pilin Flp